MLKSLKKFSGWITPQHSSSDHQHVHKTRHSTWIGPVLGLRHMAHVVSVPSKRDEPTEERIVYVGCVHGGNEDIYERLEKLSKHPPNHLIFAGDMTGSPEIEKLKKEFYDFKDWLSNPNQQNIPRPTLSFNAEHDLSEFQYFGEWAAKLARKERKYLLDSLTVSAERLVRVLGNLRDVGVKITLLEGNWDSPTVSGVKSLVGEDINPDKVFDARTFYRKHGFSFITKIELLETKTTVHILMPYISILHFDLFSKRHMNDYRRRVVSAREEGKSIIMVGHAEANWRMHHLWQEHPEAHGLRGTVIRHFGEAIALFQPDEVIYPHQHGRIRDEEGKLVPLDMKYILEMTNNGVTLIDTPQKINGEKPHAVVTYVPFGYMAEERMKE